MTRSVDFVELGTIRYQEAFEYQEKIFEQLISDKIKSRNGLLSAGIQDKFILCEHPHVITMGNSGMIENLLVNDQILMNKGIEFYKTNRGGDITYHGPGQIVGYPILNLESYSMRVKKYIENLEEVVIQTLLYYGISSGRANGMTGVWLDSENIYKARKICAIGVKISRFISMHGFAFNINTDLSYYDYIVPCGIKGRSVTSLQVELGRNIDLSEVKTIIKRKFEEVFNAKLI